jgi:hypothetical protein
MLVAPQTRKMHCHSTCGSEASHEKQMVFSDSKTSAMGLE